ncbi:pentatricopeptide repeat-containing protein At3g12770 [Primulina huaijiensis]|uniref:pentatricopeptide repeat-containing protein At3g12770 n=1 Tax=Primulina huaijiensis TaxID=1492673 RepID=UPI003CC6F1C2
MSSCGISLKQRPFRFPYLFFRSFKFESNRRLFSNYFYHTSDSFGGLEFLYASLLEKSTGRNHLNQIHSQLYRHGLQSDGFVITKLIRRCCDLKEVEYARQLFDEFPKPYVSLWNAIIKGYSTHDMLDKVVEMYWRMQGEFVSPDSHTFPHVLKACGGLAAEEIGLAVHAQILRHGLEGDVVVQNGLVAFYVKCGQNDCARVVFDGLSNRNVVSWTSIISGYTQHGHPMDALRIFRDMRGSGVKPDWISLVSAAKAYSDVDDMEQGRCLHSLVTKMGLEFEPDLRIALTSLYAKCGQVMAAKSLFDRMKVQNVILWNAMISGFVKNGHANEALDLFHEMISKKIKPDSVTLQSAVLATAQLGSLEQARLMGGHVKNSEFRDNLFVNTALIDMYSKCGNVELARQIFNQIVNKDIVVWSSMIMGYALHGLGKEAAELFDGMKHARVSPNDVTFLGLITACSHSGLIDKGWEFFNSMKEFGIEPSQQHYAGVVDLLGRAGCLEKAYNFITTMPVQPGVSVWGALLSACKTYRGVALGEYAAGRLFALDPLNIGHYVQLSNLYAASRMWDGVAKVRVMMKKKGLNKDLGYSTVEINGRLQAFRMGDKSHLRSEEIYDKLEWLETRLLECGFSPDKESALHDLDDEEKEAILCNHSERLAIAYGLISTAPGTILRITKNLRACVNCHLATKLISNLVDREIVVRDTNRFHHFKKGSCSCGDYW